MSKKRRLLDVEALRDYLSECGCTLSGIDVLKLGGHIQLPLKKLTDSAYDVVFFGNTMTQEDWDEFWDRFMVEVDADA
jgi:hypothetical protein